MQLFLIILKMSDIKTNIIEKLKTINYPGFNRDIVSFGIIKDILINDKNTINFILSLKTDNNEHKDIITNSINDLINNEFNFKNINISFLDDDSLSNNRNSLNIKNIIAFASCKGGVGKSTISLNVACQLAKKYKVGFLDLDIYGPSLPIMIDFDKQPILKDNKLIPIEKFGIKFMSFGFLNSENSPAIWRGPMVARMTQQFFDNVDWGDLDYLILDLPPGTGDIQLTLVQKIQLTGSVIITTPQDLSLADVKKGSDMFKKVNVPLIGVVENMSQFCISGKLNNYLKSSEVELSINENKIDIQDDGNFKFSIDIFKGSGGELESNRLNIPLLGKIFIDPILSECSDNGVPYMVTISKSENFSEFEKITQKIADFK